MRDEYQRTATALARETRMSDASAARIEEQLLTAMSTARSAAARSSNDARKWLAAAAIIGFIAGGLALWKVSPGTSLNRTTTQRSVSKDIVLGVSAKADVVTTANPPQRAHRKPAVQRTQTARVIRPNGFVELPWTAGLPAFESGEIVRVEVPVASLPAYGFDISRGTNRSVEADVLVGQDGLARAMRLVTNRARSTQ
jgi:hypothetical protein